MFNFSDKSACLCRICGKQLARRSSLWEHEKRHRKAAPYVCCGRQYFSKANFKRHRCNQHGEKKDFSCINCGASFPIRADLNRHMRRESGLFQQVCEICGLSFDSKSKLLDHKGVHEKVKRHQCTICFKSFRFNSNLCRHRKSHLASSVQCAICRKTFVNKFTLKQHLRKHMTTT